MRLEYLCLALTFDRKSSICSQHFTNPLHLNVFILNIVGVLGSPLFRKQADRGDRVDSKATGSSELLALWGQLPSAQLSLALGWRWEGFGWTPLAPGGVAVRSGEISSGDEKLHVGITLSSKSACRSLSHFDKDSRERYG